MKEAAATEKITSTDGTQIAYRRSGSGSPLVLVHGTGGSAARWAPIVPALAKHFNVCVVDRRGRGESGDSDTYAIEREYEDIAAVVDAMDEPANLLAHSFGGILALEAALLTRNLRKLILYEGVPIPGAPMFPEGISDRLQALLDADDREGVLTVFMREVVRLSPDELVQFKSSPAWPTRVAAAHTVPREMRAQAHYQFIAQRFKDMRIPTLLLTGGDSPAFVKEATETVNRAVPSSQIVMLPGQKHVAMYTAPDLFIQAMLAFCK
jgi:pimeloyl-ACP methyl ester carboxylesterase